MDLHAVITLRFYIIFYIPVWQLVSRLHTIIQMQPVTVLYRRVMLSLLLLLIAATVSMAWCLFLQSKLGTPRFLFYFRKIGLLVVFRAIPDRVFNAV
jgi:hypothetical protein